MELWAQPPAPKTAAYRLTDRFLMRGCREHRARTKRSGASLQPSRQPRRAVKRCRRIHRGLLDQGSGGNNPTVSPLLWVEISRSGHATLRRDGPLPLSFGGAMSSGAASACLPRRTGVGVAPRSVAETRGSAGRGVSPHAIDCHDPLRCACRWLDQCARSSRCLREPEWYNDNEQANRPGVGKLVERLWSWTALAAR